MSSYNQILYQIVFGTKYRKPTIVNDNCEELYRYIWGILKNNKCKLFRINGIEDHLHIVCSIHPSVSLANLVKDIKVSTSVWMKQNNKFPHFEGWAEGYGAFTYSIKEKNRVIEYVKNQKIHHKKSDFLTEYKNLLKEHSVEYDERYLV